MTWLTRGAFCGVALSLACCGTTVNDASEPGAGPAGVTAVKGDRGAADDVASANRFFLTQIFDAHWNPDGVEIDTESNNCGPASLAMLMRARTRMPAGLSAEQAIDHARALMHPAYPDIAPESLHADAVLDTVGDVVLLDDDSTRVFYDPVEDAPAAPHGIVHLGGTPTYGGDWDALNRMLSSDGMAIAYGFITTAWRDRFPGEYGALGTGAIPHFIAIFAASDPAAAERYIVCDPMHHGGAVAMSQTRLSAFFRSPVNVFETSMRLLGWEETPVRQRR